ncbi:alpha/beta hydrolase [Nocardioides sp. JQ2195]|uniref:alpha/beta hydrolase n=1 Tax=Nocardioides sp. JQ2195 TaxID=2592334 RepID=UPI00143E6F06|nr:alpha/beta hydrolase [Nocardioides sp. JQ2195]QIX26554.1 alpha/beta hydrolase [Nocardioides sp. JQ2195]
MWDTEVTDLLDALNAGFPRVEEMTGAQARESVAARRAPVTNLDDVERVEDVQIPSAAGPVGARIYHPHGSVDHSRPLVVFFHGGGFVFCSVETHDGFARAMSRATGAVVISVDYRLAPEHKAPAAAEDALAATVWAADNALALGADPRRLVVMGDSAGGNLAAVVPLMARERGGPAIAAQVLAYPMIDPACSSPSMQQYATGHFNTLAATRWYWEQYLPDGTGTPTHHVAPLESTSLAGLPPAIVVTAQRDPLAGDGRRYAEALRASGVPVVHREYAGLFHGFLTILGLGAAKSARDLLWHDLATLVAAGETPTRGER